MSVFESIPPIPLAAPAAEAGASGVSTLSPPEAASTDTNGEYATVESETTEVSEADAVSSSDDAPTSEVTESSVAENEAVTSAPSEAPEAVIVAEPATETETSEEEAEDEEEEEEVEAEFSPSFLFLEDFVVTALLSAGRALRGNDLAARAEGWKLPRQGLQEALANSTRVKLNEREWDCTWRLTRRGQSREERSRAPLEALLRELLLQVGKPLPVPVIAREIGLMRNISDLNLKDQVAGVLKTLRFAIEIAPGVYIHEDWLLKVGAPRDEVLIRENQLNSDPDFEGLMQFAEISGTTAPVIARELMEFTGGPLSQKIIGFWVHRANPTKFSARELAGVLNDRTQFQPLLGGFVALQDSLVELKAQTQEWLEELAGPQEEVDVPMLLRTRVASADVVTPKTDDLEEIKKRARALSANEADNPDGILDVAKLVLEFYDIEHSDAALVPTIQGLNDALRRDPDWLPMGIGRFLLRENIPPHVGQVPEILRPVTLSVLNRETGEPFDRELDDEGLEANSAAWIHAPQWEDVGEEAEVQGNVRPAIGSTKLVMLNHHMRAGTFKLRRIDEEIWNLSAPIAKISIFDRDTREPIEVWASRESGLVYGVGEWCDENMPPSGGTVKIEREGDELLISADAPDAGTYLTQRRSEELEELEPASRSLSLYELLQRILGAHPNGMDIAAVWAEVNVVRRTSKRLIASVLSSYGCFVVKQRGPETFLWRYDDEKDKSEAGFKNAKKRFVRE